MDFIGPLKKMFTTNTEPVDYVLEIGNDILMMNSLIGKKLSLKFEGKIKCNCGELKDKVFRANFCYDCFYTKPEAGEPIFNPEKSTAHLGIEDRDLEWEKRNQLQPHLVYLANSSGIKVGVTRLDNMLTRWMDQGASEGIKLLEVPNRYLAGVAEVALKKHIADKTVWQRMLKGEVPEVDMLAKKKELFELLPDDLKQYLSLDDEVTKIVYPVEIHPAKVTSRSFAKVQEIEGVLKGIKGQYLIFEGGQVFNVRSHEGYITALGVN